MHAGRRLKASVDSNDTHPAAQGRVACVDSGVGRLVRHVENGLLEIFLTVYDFKND